MKRMPLRVLLPLIVCGSLGLPAIKATAQGVPPGPGYPPAAHAAHSAGYLRQNAWPTAGRQQAANAVLESTVGYRLADPFGPQIQFEGIFGDRRGIDGNDYSVSTLLPWHIDPNKNVVYAVLRGTTTDLGDFVGNFGIGQRMYFEDLNRILGYSGWYDVDDTHNATYRRAGGQIEYIGRYLEVRGGADIVLGNNRTLLAQGFTDDDPRFVRDNIAFTFFRRNEFAYDQGYIEAGGPAPILGRYGINLYGGAYFLWNDDDREELGWSVRTTAALTRDVNVGFRFTRDDIFEANASVNVSLAFPNGGLKQMFRSPRSIVRGQTPDTSVSNQVLKLRPGSVESQMASYPYRDHRMPVDIRRLENNVLAIDPRTGDAICVIHVDPNATSAGSGSFEDPFRSLEAARLSNDGSCPIIRVIPRDDGTGANLAVTEAFELFDFQRMLASSQRHLFSTTRGTFELPGFTGSGSGPLVTNSNDGDLIFLNDGTEVSGMQLVGSSTGSGIVGGPDGFDINRNEIRDALNGILLTNASGIGLIDENDIHDNIDSGASILNPDGGMLDVTVTDNSITDTTEGDGLVLSTTDGTITGRILDNEITGNKENGVTLSAGGGGTLDFRSGGVIARNEFGSNKGDGFRVNSTGDSTVELRFLDNDFGATSTGGAGNQETGFRMVADSGWATIDIGGPDAADGNRFRGNLMTAAQFDLTGTADLSLLFQNNFIGQPMIMLSPGDLIRAGFDSDTLAANDDGSTGLVPIGFNANFFGVTFNDLFVNNNGNLTFNNPLGTFTPFPIVTNGIPMIAPFFGDVDTRAGNEVTYGQGTVDGRAAFGVNYVDVRHFNVNGTNQGLPTNTFQVVLIDRSDIGAGDFDIEFSYDEIVWEAGEASGSDAFGLGGSAARVGFTNGTNNSFELAGSGVNGAFLDSGPAATSLINNNINSSLLGRYVFEARNGDVTTGGDMPTGPAVDGLQVNTSGDAIVKRATIDSNSIASITGTAIHFQADDGSSVEQLRISNNQISNVAENAIRLHANALADIELVGLTDNMISDSGINGFAAEATESGVITIADVTGNTFTGHVENGLFIRADGIDGGAATVSGSIGVGGEDINLISSNMGFGIRLESNEGGSILGPSGNPDSNFLIVNNEITENGMGGIGAFADATAPDQSTLNLTVGGPLVEVHHNVFENPEGNLIDANVDVGIGYILRGNSTGNLVVLNNTITNTVDDAMMMTEPFIGQGIYIEVSDTSTLPDGLIDMNTIADNAGSGIHGFVQKQGVVTDMLIGNLDGDNDNGNIITGNAIKGIRWERRDAGIVTNLQIIDNTINTNGNGIHLVAANADTLDTYVIDDNMITENNNNGILLEVQADADMQVDIDNNIISMNVEDGIAAAETSTNTNDSRSIGGTWTNNIITENAEHGIDFATVADGLVVGTAGMGNLISMNGMNGVSFSGGGSLSFTDNIVTDNGTGGFDFDPVSGTPIVLAENFIAGNGGTGIDLDFDSSLGPVDLFLIDNEVVFNEGDGLEIRAFGDGTSLLTVTSSGNTYGWNDGRGVDILNQENAVSVLSFDMETITSNGLEGFYVVNTASATQNQTDLATDPLAADGAVDAVPILSLTLTDSEVSFNGLDSTFDGTGLVLRVGTSDGSEDFDDPGGFVSTNGTTGTLTGRGGVVARVIGNNFSGNNGDDVIIESFVSTVVPATTAGTWDDMGDADPTNDVFNVTTYRADPLARLDLTFTDNTGDSADVTRFGAFYENSEPDFKSRLMSADPGGPFDLATRRRNAQRLASRAFPFDAPTVNFMGSGAFLYPGVGDSTVRIFAGSVGTNSFPTFFDGFGDFEPLRAVPFIGELDFVWGTFP